MGGQKTAQKYSVRGQRCCVWGEAAAGVVDGCPCPRMTPEKAYYYGGRDDEGVREKSG